MVAIAVLCRARSSAYLAVIAAAVQGCGKCRKHEQEQDLQVDKRF
jgi:hypothetical protein